MSVELFIQLVLWFLGFIFLWKIPLCKSQTTKLALHRSMSIVIPARNEEKTLPLLLNSLKGQLEQDDEVIVVDDHSDDQTSMVARQYGAKIVQSQPLPRGWLGKTWACYQGAQSTGGELLLFLDADTIIEPDGILKIISSYNSSGGAMSIQPYHKMLKVYEQFSAFFNIVLMGAMGAFTIFGNLIKPIGLFGPVIVLTKQRYLESGGFEKVRGEILEDLEYGAALKKQHIKLSCYGGRGSVSFRMYPEGIGQLVTGWSKGFAKGAAKTSIIVLIMVVAWITGAVGTTRNLIESLAFADTVGILSWGIIYAAYVAQIYWMLHRVGNFSFFTALFFPVPLLFFIFVFTYSFINIFIRRSVSWKGRKIEMTDGGHK
ncbi:glycosyltransferase [Chloroflexota bacterium]